MKEFEHLGWILYLGDRTRTTKTEKPCESSPKFRIVQNDIQEFIALFKALGFARFGFQ